MLVTSAPSIASESTVNTLEQHQCAHQPSTNPTFKGILLPSWGDDDDDEDDEAHIYSGYKKALTLPAGIIADASKDPNQDFSTDFSAPTEAEPPQKPVRTLPRATENSSLRSCLSNNASSNRRETTPSAQLRRAVSFGDRSTHQIIPIEHVGKIHRRERSRRWFNQQDLAFSRSENENLLQLMEMTGSFDEKTCLAQMTNEKNVAERFTIRGLERHTIQGKTRYYENYRDSVSAVLLQQQIISKVTKSTKSKNQDYSDTISALYKQETEAAKKEAAHQGKLDAKEVRRYLQENCDMDSIRSIHLAERRKTDQHQRNVPKFGFLRTSFANRNRSSLSLHSV